MNKDTKVIAYLPLFIHEKNNRYGNIPAFHIWSACVRWQDT